MTGPSRTAPENPFGITGLAHWPADSETTKPLIEELADQELDHEVVELPRLLTPAGDHAHLVGYTSPASGLPVTVLAIPDSEVHSWGETYYYLEGLAITEALRLGEDHWIGVHEEMRII